MTIELKSEHEVSEASCREATGKALSEWFALIDSDPSLATKRRDAINWLYDQTGRGKDTWWPTTIWVEYEASKGRVQKDGRPEGYNICVTKTIAAPIERVFSSFQGSGLNGWLGASAASPDGSFEAKGSKAEATRVRENKDLRYKWTTAGATHPTEVEVQFTDKGNGKTGLLLNHNRIAGREEADGLRKAWGEAFDRLKAQLES